MLANSFLAAYAIVLYYTIIVVLRVQNITSFTLTSSSFLLFSKNKAKPKVSSKVKKSKGKKKATQGPQLPSFGNQLSKLIREIWENRNQWHFPKKSQIIIITVIAIVSYFMSFSIETLIITYLYLCAIYLVSLVYFSYVETKEENKQLKQKLLLQEQAQKRKKQKRKKELQRKKRNLSKSER